MHALAFEDSVLPIMRAEKAILVEDDFELDKGSRSSPATATRRATSSSTWPRTASEGVFIGDVIHHPMQLLFPDLSTRADFDQDAARLTRRALIDRHADAGTVVLPQHFATPVPAQHASRMFAGQRPSRVSTHIEGES